MTEKILPGQRDGTIERQPGGTVVVFVALALVVSIKLLVLLGLRIGLVDGDSVALTDALNGAGESAAVWAFVALVLGGAVCARRDRGRTRRCVCQIRPHSRKSAMGASGALAIGKGLPTLNLKAGLVRYPMRVGAR